MTYQWHDLRVSIEMIIMGGLFVMGIYNIVLFSLLRKGFSYFCFGLLCFFICLRMTVTGEMYLMQVFPSAGFEAVRRIELLTYALSVPLCLTVIRSLFEDEFHKRVIQVIWFAGALCSLIIIATPYKFYINVMGAYDVLTVALCLYTIAMMARASMLKRKGALLMLAGTVLISIGVFNDILLKSGITNTIDMFSYFLFVFLVSQIYLISVRFIYLYKQEAAVAGELRKKSISLERSRNLLLSLFDSLSSALVAVDINSKITKINASAGKCTNKSELQSIVGSPVSEVYPVSEKCVSALRGVLENCKPAVLSGERLKTGDERIYNISIDPLKSDHSCGAVIVADDVTEKFKKEDQIKRAQKMETIGILAGGLAHDFNNALGGILATATLMKYSITEDIEKEKNSKRVMMIDHAATNAAELVHRFLNLAKKHEVTFSPVELNETVQRIAKICRDTTDKRIEIKTSYVMDDAFILADPVQIEHLLLNLCINAVQAMAHMGETGEPKKGVLGISIGSLNIDSVYAAGHSGVEQGDYWSVSVSDTGSGIDNEMKEKIFEPFFSTKEAGTGLGLVMVDSIVKQHGGFIELSSEKGRGSVFTVFIRQYKGQTKRPASKIEKQTDEKGAGIILLAEDDEIIREMTSDIFTENGYTVIAAENGEEALDIFRQRFFEIKGVFMDLAMPVLSGTDAFLAMREIYPDVKVLMTSGFASESSIRDAVDKGVAGFIRKPYSIQELLAKAREVFG